MRIEREGGQVWLRDRAAPFWAVGVFLLAGGALGIAMPLGLAQNAGDLKLWERLASGGIGIGSLLWSTRMKSPVVTSMANGPFSRTLMTRGMNRAARGG